ncbi:potassium-transporting ATPase subunit KdpC [Pectinatus sottacetonis]|uniref:potassium-transporting ATPase subunit KdpC n=1 Tax=Pectinatus sottacetonis TaxID=1002795 RepID=UPI0018C7AAFB|nr:potassium-transporting ATPase subunit KdpC [Pectinatus sottacetonis]
MAIVKKAFLSVIFFTILCGFVYTMVVTGISQALFAKETNGRIIEVNGIKYGSELMAQQFTGNKYMWGRIMKLNIVTVNDKSGAKLMYAAPSNLSPASNEYKEIVARRVAKIKAADPQQGDKPIPVDLVTNSGSGLDPDISLAAAQYQIPRIAKYNNMSFEEVQRIIDKCTSHKIWGFLGEETVNVLKVNLMLEHIL